MFYSFPTIEHIDDVLPHIEGHSEFFVAERDNYKIVDYTYATPTSFGNLIINEDLDHSSKIRRECRGLKFDKDGKVLARGFHKFFNLSEKEETQLDRFKWDNSIILEKLDGSLIQATMINDQLSFMTMMGETDIAKMAFNHAQRSYNTLLFCRTLIKEGYTPIFEFCSRKNQVVVDYPEDRLVLTALRHTKHGNYIDYNTMIDRASRYEVLCVQRGTQRHEGEDIKQYIDRIYAMQEIEGFVVRFTNGHMIKIKCESYVRKHQAKEGLIQEKNVIGLIVNKELDDIKSSLTSADLVRVEKFELQFWQGTQTFIEMLNQKYKEGKALAKDDKRIFAIEFVNKQESMLKPLLFQMWTDQDAASVVIDFIKDNINSQSNVDKIRAVFATNWQEIE